MKKQKKFLWFYSVLLFSASLLLILISALSQSRLTPSDTLSQKDEQQAFNQSIQKSVTELIRENEALREDLKEAKDRLAILEEDAAAASEEIKQKQFTSEATEFLVEAEMYFNIGNYAKSRDVLKNANAHMLSEQSLKLYEWLTDKLAKKGYKLYEE